MGVSDKILRMVYALGNVDRETEKGRITRLKLVEVNPDWAGYTLSCYVRGEDSNDDYDLRYEGAHGVETANSLLITIRAGFNTRQLAWMLIKAIEDHKLEMLYEES